MVSHFFKVVKLSDSNILLFSMEPHTNQIYKNFHTLEFVHENFKFKKVSTGGEIWMLKAPKNDVKLKIEIDILDKFGKYSDKIINVYHVYVERYG